MDLKSNIQKVVGSRRNRFALVLAAIASKALDGFAFVSRQTFAPDRRGFNALVGAEKIPVCPVKGSRCSNDHYTLTNGNKTVQVSEACGTLLHMYAQASEPQRKTLVKTWTEKAAA